MMQILSITILNKFNSQGYREKIVDIKEEILRKRRAGKWKLPGDSSTVLKAWWNASSSSLNYDMSYSVPTSSEGEPKKRKGMGSALEKAFQSNAREQCDGEIARMFYTGGLPFNIARNPHNSNSYIRASNIPGYVPPGYNALRTTLLQKERMNIEHHLQPIKDTWKTKGVSICSDGWSDPQRRLIFNIIAANDQILMFEL
ncbi:hypothetical protein ACLB2K_038458 [Fragaria x ananassa]